MCFFQKNYDLIHDQDVIIIWKEMSITVPNLDYNGQELSYGGKSEAECKKNGLVEYFSLFQNL